jgi:hypothetical protein
MAREFTEFEFILADGAKRYEIVEDFENIRTFADMHNAILAWSLEAFHQPEVYAGGRVEFIVNLEDGSDRFIFLRDANEMPTHPALPKVRTIWPAYAPETA